MYYRDLHLKYDNKNPLNHSNKQDASNFHFFSRKRSFPVPSVMFLCRTLSDMPEIVHFTRTFLYQFVFNNEGVTQEMWTTD